VEIRGNKKSVKSLIFFGLVLILSYSITTLSLNKNRINNDNYASAFVPSSNPSQSTNDVQDQSSSNPTSQQSTLVVHLKTHIFTFFEQPVTVQVFSPDGSVLKSSTAVVHPRNEKIVNFALPSNSVETEKPFKVCTTNDKYGKQECTEATKNSDSPQMDVYMTVP
jgi:hypothetical protein